MSACDKGWALGRIGSLRLNVIAFNAAISACETSCQWRKEDLLLYVVSFNAAMSACDKGCGIGSLHVNVIAFKAAISA
eukprot:11813081-Karenia_brevis.AAC.1